MYERTLRVLEFDKIVKRLVDMAVSEPGKEYAGQLMPENDYLKIQGLLKETSDGVSYVIRRGNPPLGGIHDIRGSLKRIDMGAVLNPGELLRISDILRACRNLKNYANDIAISGNENIVGELIGLLETDRRVEEKIRLAVINEDELSDYASSSLAGIRRQIKDRQNSIKDRLNDFIKSAKYQKYIQEPIVTIRSDRYVVPVKQEYRSEVPGMVHDSSSSGATIFIEPMAVVEANNNIKQLRIKEQVEIERILGELTSDAGTILDELKTDVSVLARLDFIFAKARLSLDNNCSCPVINSERHIRIKKGRHPLLDRKSVVPIDFWIGDEFNVLVITGPNTGGKTVTLKTVGLFTLMTQAGLHIPANDGTEIGIFNNIFADIGDEQSIEQSLSTFSSHMTNIVKILEGADDRSLVLFDELGAGTDPTEGAALGMAILENLKNRKAVTVATTHYSELKIYAVSTVGVENACCEFDVETLKPTYRLLIGVPGKSNAFAISGRLGLPGDILERAREFLTQEDIEFEDVLMSIEKNRNESEKERIKAENYRIEAESLKKELDEQKIRLDAQKERIIREAREEARRILLSTKEESNSIIAELKRAEREFQAAESTRVAEETRLRLQARINSMDDSLVQTLMPKRTMIKPPENLKPGDSVLVVNLGQKGTVVIPPDKDGEVVVQVGIMKINVHISNLQIVDEQDDEIKRTDAAKIGISKARSISTEIDLRGLTLDEAVVCVDKYLDDSSIAGLNEVSIIHGKGTGVLRNGIQQYLKSNSHVKSYRLGRFGEGEAGVTIVELK